MFDFFLVVLCSETFYVARFFITYTFVCRTSLRVTTCTLRSLEISDVPEQMSNLDAIEFVKLWGETDLYIAKCNEISDCIMVLLRCWLRQFK